MSQKDTQFRTWYDFDVLVIEISGPIDERTRFQELPKSDKMQIMLERLTTLNSPGIRTWLLWMQTFREATSVSLTHVPVIMVNAMASVAGFIRSFMTVDSFYVPFYDDETGESTRFLAIRGKHYGNAGKLMLPEVKTSTGKPMELDVSPEVYFSFLKQ
ncbi:MAG: hypothetical protein AB7F86_06795 [Bdellovibrionales bacterium]